jgi:lipopolysaccharide/colanic/teichoic acid biosynthesis glycosyltransferase
MRRRIWGVHRNNVNGQEVGGAADASSLRLIWHPDRKLVHTRTGAKGRRLLWAKRPFDLLVSSLGLLGSLPIWLLIAVSIKLDDGGPVFYSQERVGMGGRRYRSYKFRSMIPEADRRFGPLQARAHDHRVTRVGRFLRATALDELPQLWNIVKGELSFVGPRALLPEEIEVRPKQFGVPGFRHTIQDPRVKEEEFLEAVPLEKIPGYVERHQVQPGLTGLAQVYADRDIPRRHKFKYDLLYIKRQTFWLDLKLIALSFWITFHGTWEHRGRKF